nr:hypothetical protein [uncultured Dongia sp.]
MIRLTGITNLATMAAFFVGTACAMAADGTTLQDSVRKANDRFKDVAVAVKEGYAPIPCASGIEGGAMGVHYVNANLINDTVELGKPEAVMYEPMKDGKMKLVAVEYIATKGPANLQGHLFSFANAPNRYGLPAFYELHVWAWKHNPSGTFADMNPDVSCDAMTDMTH